MFVCFGDEDLHPTVNLYGHIVLQRSAGAVSHVYLSLSLPFPIVCVYMCVFTVHVWMVDVFI